VRKSWYISRRTLLQTAGCAIALPVLDAMVRTDARAGGDAPPKRILHFHGQIYGYVGREDAELATTVAPWSAQTTGYEVALQNNTYLRPFFDKGLESKITVLTGVTDRVLVGTHDSPVKAVANTYPLAMQSGGCVILTAEPNASTFVGDPPQPDPYDGASADQIAAMHISEGTAIDSLTMAVQDVGGAFATWPMSNKSRNEPIPAIQDPKDAFDRLFAGYDPEATAAEQQLRADRRKSVLDGVREDAARLEARLGKSDREKLDGYLESVRNLERQIDASIDLPVDVEPPGTSDTYANYELKQKAMQELIANAFITDRTRVIAFSGAYAGGWLNFRGPGQEGLDYAAYRQFNGDPLGGSHHTMSHYDQGIDGSAPSDGITAMKKDHMEIFTHWSLEMFSELLAQLDGYMDIDGASTILDNTVAIYGGDDSDSARHGYLSMPCIIGGGGGGAIRSGRELRFVGGGSGERSWKDLLWGALRIVGVPGLTTFGYATNAIDDALAG
jgi:hypothetical protein